MYVKCDELPTCDDELNIMIREIEIEREREIDGDETHIKTRVKCFNEN